MLALHEDVVRRNIDLDVWEDDEMYRSLFDQHANRDAAISAYFASGESIARAFTKILNWRFEASSKVGRLLDFASGYGRTTRFLLETLPAERIWVADVQLTAVETQKRQFGVHGFVSATAPADLPEVGRFDAITVSSLFTHLPAPSFRAWLKKLGSLVAPRGVLVLSVHDVALLGEGQHADFSFRPSSESTRLDTSEYGSSWASERFVRTAVLDELGISWSVERFPRGLVAHQDVYVLVPEPVVDFSKLRLRREVDGFVERLELDVGNRLHCSGWLADRQRGKRPVAVELLVGGQKMGVVEGAALRAGADAAAVLGVGGTAFHYEFLIDLGGDRSDTSEVAIEAVFERERVDLLRLPLGAALLRGARLAKMYQGWRAEAESSSSARHEAALNARVADLERRVEWMASSRFWKLRDAWWRVRGLFGRAG
jgi:SAM-dependent methyltransferase